MKVAIVHDFLTQMGGAEKVVETLREMFPGAPVYTSIYEPDAMPASYRSWDIRTSFLQKLMWKKKTHRLALMLYPAAFESFDLSEYDLVISSSSAFAKGVVTQPHTTHVCYTHAPMRYAWATNSYVQGERVARPLQGFLRTGLHKLRTWDAVAATRVDTYVANSSAVAARIHKFYRRNCEVVFPPVDTSKFQVAPPEEVGEYYVIVSRAVAYKRLDLAVDAFSKMGRKLKVVGSGRAMKAMKATAGPSVEFLGHVPDSELPGLMARARGFLMPGEEDFGIAAVESLACGRPVIAYAAGGSLDVQRDGVTGVLFGKQTVDALCEAVERAETISWDSQAIRDYAVDRFDTAQFKARMALVVERALDAKKLTLNLRGEGGWDGVERRNGGWNGVERRENGRNSDRRSGRRGDASMRGQGAASNASTANAANTNGHNGHAREAEPSREPATSNVDGERALDSAWRDATLVARPEGEERPEFVLTGYSGLNGHSNGHNGHNGRNGHNGDARRDD